ncbi:MAG: tetratricopeptide repeat protein, partial [Bacteroidota bacterium]
ARLADELYFKKGDIYYGQQMFDSAIVAYKDFLVRFPNSKLAGDANFWIGKCYGSMGNQNAALQFYTVAADQYPQSGVASAALFELGMLSAQQAKPDAALAAFAKIEETYPNADEAPEASYQQALVFKGTGQLAAAVKKFEETIAQYPKKAAADRSKLALGWMNYESEQYPKAIEYFKSVAVNRSDEIAAEAQYAVGLSYQAQQNISEAIVNYLRVRYVFPSSVQWISRAYFNLGDCYVKTNQISKAKEAYTFVVKQNKIADLVVSAEKKLKSLEQL